MTMPEWITKYWIEWIFGLLCTGLVLAYNKLAGKIKKESEEREALKNGLRALLRRQIIEDCRTLIQEGQADPDRRDTILDMYNCYHALGGNGTVTRIKDEMMALPTK